MNKKHLYKIKSTQNQNILPKDVKIVSFYDREDLVNLAVKTVTHNLIEGILLDIGFAYDGDADRCIAVDHKGNVVDGDKISVQ